MIIRRISGQKRKSLIQFYEPFDGQPQSARVALPAMQQLLNSLYEIDGPDLFAFTSHYRLNFVSGDSHTLPVIARVTPGCTPTSQGAFSPLFHISYPANPEVGRDDRDWPINTAESVEEAIQLLFSAFRNSAFSPLPPS